MVRVPNAGRAGAAGVSGKAQQDLVRFQRIPPSRREAECADEGEATYQHLLGKLGAPGFEKPPQTGEIEALLFAALPAERDSSRSDPSTTVDHPTLRHLRNAALRR